MKALVLKGRFGVENLVVEERPEPSVGPRQLLIKMLGDSINYRDLLMVRGKYNPRQALPLVPGSDGVGEVTALGPDVEGFQVGERVCPIVAPGWISGRPTRDRLKDTLGGPRDGTFSEYLVCDARSVVRVPAHLTDLEAACLPCAGVTAWSALVEQGRVRPGDTVLILGTGGVSLFSVSFAKMLGAKVIITSKSGEKLARARTLGADECINYARDQEWGKTARTLSGGEGVDHVIEVGGAATLDQSLIAVRPGGRISLIGVLGGSSGSVSLTRILMQNVRVQGVLLGSRETFEAMNRAIELTQFRPTIDRVFPLEAVPQALEYLGSGAHFGKVCVQIAER